jgi:ribose-phosphate pyrophosphokinase
MHNRLKIFAGNSNSPLADEICEHIGAKPGNIHIRKFSNENIKIKIKENVRGADVFVIQTASPPVNEHLVELLIIIDALKYASAGRITAVLPYYFYARSDKKDEPRISITSRLVADLLETAGANRILTMNLHTPQIMGFSRIPVDQLSSVDIICDYFKQKENLKNYVAVAPDIGRVKTTEAFAKYLKIPMAILEKTRDEDVEKAIIMNVIGDVEGKNILLLDDEVLTGNSMIGGAKALREHKAKRILAGCIHGLLASTAILDIENSFIEELVITNTLNLPAQKKNRKIKVLSVAKLFADAIRAIHEGTSVSKLFKIE